MPSLNTYGLQFGNTHENLIVDGENPSDFESLLSGLLTEYTPETDQHRSFVEQLALSHWHLWRRERAVHSLEANLHSFGSDPSNWRALDFERLTLLDRYKTSAERALKRALQNAESFRKERLSQQAQRERHEKWRAQQDLRERRLKLQEEQQAEKASAAAKAAAIKARNSPPQRPPINWPPEGHIPGRKFIPKVEPENAAPPADEPNRS